MYRDLNDYELIYMVEDKNEDSFNILLKKYQPLIYKTVIGYSSLFKKFGYELSDLMQLGYMTLYKALHLYNSYNETWFYSYYKKSLINTMLHIIRENTTNKKEVLNNALSYDVPIPNSNMHYIDLLKDDSIQFDYSHELVLFKNSMPVYLSWTFELLYNGFNKKEISILLDEKQESIKEHINHIKEHALTYKYLFFE